MEDKSEKYPLISIIIPTFNSAQSIVETLDSIFDQKHPAIEVVIVDAKSNDRTIDLIKNFHSPFVRIHSVSDYNVYEMLNCGITIATGSYITFMFPGDFYISNLTVVHIVKLIVENNYPDLVYGGYMARKRDEDPKILLNDFTYLSLRRGEQPTRLQGSFFKSGVFVTLGKFDLKYQVRAVFDFFCRFYLYGGFCYVKSSHALVDKVKRSQWHYSLFQYFLDTWYIVVKNFGFWVAFRWGVKRSNWHWLFSKMYAAFKKSFLPR